MIRVQQPQSTLKSGTPGNMNEGNIIKTKSNIRHLFGRCYHCFFTKSLVVWNWFENVWNMFGFTLDGDVRWRWCSDVAILSRSLRSFKSGNAGRWSLNWMSYSAGVFKLQRFQAGFLGLGSASRSFEVRGVEYWTIFNMIYILFGGFPILGGPPNHQF